MANEKNNNVKTKWVRVQKRLRTELGEDVFTSWFGRVEIDGVEGNAVYLSVPTLFLKNWIHSHYQERLLACCRAELPDVEQMEMRVRTPHDAADQAAAELAAQAAAGRAADPGSAQSTSAADELSSPLDPRLTFDNFVVGAANRLSQAAAWQISESLLRHPVRYHPLYIHASVGLGKTHLLQAIAWEVKRRNPATRVLYLTAERFIYRFVAALKARDALAFKDMLRGIDILLIDDMEFLQGRSFQQEFGHTLNSLIDNGKQVVVAAKGTPTELDSLDDRMRSRLGGGLVVEIGPFDRDIRLQILQKRAELEMSLDKSLIVPDEALEYLAARLTENGRQLEGAILHLAAAHQLAGEPVTLEVAEHIVRDLMRGREPKRVKIDDILRAISKHFGINRSDLLSSRRTRSIVRPRQIGMYLAKEMTQRSLPEIGRRFGGRDHTTVLHAVRKIEQLMGEDTAIRQDVELLRRLLEE